MESPVKNDFPIDLINYKTADSKNAWKATEI